MLARPMTFWYLLVTVTSVRLGFAKLLQEGHSPGRWSDQPTMYHDRFVPASRMTCTHSRRLALSAWMLLLALANVNQCQAFWTGGNKQEPDQQPDEGADTRRDSNGVAPTHDSVSYGVDISFPMHYDHVSTNYPWLEHNVDPNAKVPKEYQDEPIQPLGDRQKFYKDFMAGCHEKFGEKGRRRCNQNEHDRIAMTLRQPQSMQNYTEVGFKKIRAPENVFKLIKEFWDRNKDIQKPENWGMGNTYTNNWESPSYMVSVEDSTLRGGGHRLKQQIWDAARETIQDWTGEELTQCSLYGVRVYTEGAVLATHVDRLPLVSSAIINVAQDVDEPWPLEVYGHDGTATNVTMEPGDMVLYESHSVLHGRPFPLKGRYLANIFIHFEPTGHSLRHNARIDAEKKNVHEKYKAATARRVSGHEADQEEGLPSYIIAGTPEEKNWRRQHPNNKRSRQNSFATGSTSAHRMAQNGDADGLAKAIRKDKSVVKAEDENGWQPLHESARAGHVDCAKLLHDNGADVNARVDGGAGGTPLWWAVKSNGDDHPIVEYLTSVGGLSLGPEL